MRILGIVVVPLIANARVAAAADGGNVTTTVYVARHFEVRDHDQPVKYLFNGDDRVARVTGSLSNRERLQRLRLQPGWNLISLAVTAANFTGQLERSAPAPLLSALYRWRAVTHDFVGVSAGQTVEAGAVLWLRSETGALVSVTGSYSEPASVTLTAGGGYVALAGLERWSPQLPVGVTTWKYDAQSGTWQASFNGDLASAGDVPPTLAPGEAIFIHSDEAVELATPELAGRLLFYHPDHLGSAAVLTDIVGESVEETAHYPFGAVRDRQRSREVNAHYGFTQKEQDRESALHYFEARYVVGGLGRFSSFDPLLQNPEALEAGELKKLLAEPAKLNPFAYALNNPMRYVDPDGRESRDARARPRARTAQPQPRPAARRAQPNQPAQPRQLGSKLTLRLGPPNKRPDEIPVAGFSISPRRGNYPSATGGVGREHDTPQYTEIQISRLADDTTASMFMAKENGQAFESVQLIVPGKDGNEVRLHLENVLISSMSMSGAAGEVFEDLTFNAGKVWFEDPSRPAPAAQPSREQWDYQLRRGQ